MKQCDPKRSVSKLRHLFFGTTVIGPVNDLDSPDFSVRGISGKLLQEEPADSSEQKRKETSSDQDK